jgi:hypothetical protein
MDLAALITTVNEAVSPSGVSHRVLLTKVDSRSLGEALEAQNTLLELNIPACNAFIRTYKAHERAALEGHTHSFNGKANTPKKPVLITIESPRKYSETGSSHDQKTPLEMF